MRKAALVKGLLAFFAAAVLLTYLAFQLEQARTPRVQVGSPTEGALAYTASATATLTYDVVTEFTAPADLLVTKIMAEPGDALFKGVTLLQIDPDSVAAALKAAVQEVEARRLEMEALPLESAERVAAGWALTQAEEIQDRLLKIQEDGNAVRLDCEGDLLELPIQEPGLYPAGTLLAKWSDNTQDATLTWQSSDGFYLPGDTVQTALDSNEQLEITARRYLAEKNVFEYEAAVPAQEGERLSLSAYEKVTVKLIRESSRYRELLPVSALNWQNSSQAWVYTVVTDSQTRSPAAKRIEVSVRATDGTWAAVDKAFNDPIVFYSDRPLTDGEKVIVEEDNG